MEKNLNDTVMSDEQLENEIQRTIRKSQRWTVFKSTVLILLIAAAICVIAAGSWLPLYHITGHSMEPLLKQGQIVAAFRTNELERGDIAVFYHENQILVKRVIGLSGDRISIDPQGKVFVNGRVLNETYVALPALEPSNLTYPYQVPEDSYFVMGDHRAESIDSRLSSVGCIKKDAVAGKAIFRIWPIRQVDYIGWREGA